MIVHQRNRFPGKFGPVEKELMGTARLNAELSDGDVIDGLPVAVVNLASGPGLWQARCQASQASRFC